MGECNYSEMILPVATTEVQGDYYARQYLIHLLSLLYVVRGPKQLLANIIAKARESKEEFQSIYYHGTR